MTPALLPEHAAGLIALSGCPQGELAQLVAKSRFCRSARRWSGNTWTGSARTTTTSSFSTTWPPAIPSATKRLLALAQETGARVVATGNVHYHVRERHQLQDCLVAIRHCKSLEETHRERRPNSEFYLRPQQELEALFQRLPRSPGQYAGNRRTLHLRSDQRPQLHLPRLSRAGRAIRPKATWKSSAMRRPSGATALSPRRCSERLDAGVPPDPQIQPGRLPADVPRGHQAGAGGDDRPGLSDPSLTVEENPPGQGPRLVGGAADRLSHRPFPHRPAEVQPLAGAFPARRYHDQRAGYRPRFSAQHPGRAYPADAREMGLAARRPHRHHRHLPDKRRRHGTWARRWGCRRRKSTSWQSSSTGAAPGTSAAQMEKMPAFQGQDRRPGLARPDPAGRELDGFPKYMGQHPGGMILSSTPLIDIVPVQRGAIEGRYVCQWDKDSIDDAGFVKIDFLALGALSQLQEAVELIKQRTGKRIDYVPHRLRGCRSLRHALQGRYHRHLPGGVGGPDADHHPPQAAQPAGHGPRGGGGAAGRGRQPRRAGIPGPAQRQESRSPTTIPWKSGRWSAPWAWSCSRTRSTSWP